MRSINITFDDKDFNELEKAKGKKSWREFFLSLYSNEYLEEEE